MKTHAGRDPWVQVTNKEIEERQFERIWPENHGKEEDIEEQLGALWNGVFSLPRDERRAFVIVRRLNILDSEGQPNLSKEMCDAIAKAAGLKKTRLYELAKVAKDKLASQIRPAKVG